MIHFSSVQSLSRVQVFATPWTAALQASLSITNSRSLLKLMSIELVMRSNHLFLCRPLLLLPSIFPSIRVFSSESTLHMRWPKYWSFSFSISTCVKLHEKAAINCISQVTYLKAVARPKISQIVQTKLGNMVIYWVSLGNVLHALCRPTERLVVKHVFWSKRTDYLDNNQAGWGLPYVE